MTQAMDYLLAGNIEKAVLTNPLIVVLLPLGILINLICMLDFCTLFKHNHMKRFIQKVILKMVECRHYCFGMAICSYISLSYI